MTADTTRPAGEPMIAQPKSVQTMPWDHAVFGPRGLSAKDANEHSLARAICRHYLETGNAATVTDLARSIGVSESTIRKWIDATSGGVPIGCTFTEVDVPRREQNYGSIVGYRKATAFVPSDRSMRLVVLAVYGLEPARDR